MTDTEDGSTDWEPSDEGDGPEDDAPTSGREDSHEADAPTNDAEDVSASAAGVGVGRDRSLAEYVQWGLLAILLLLTVIATLRFYFAASTAVDRFVTRQYRPLFQAAFNLVILLVAGVGLSILVRRLS